MPDPGWIGGAVIVVYAVAIGGMFLTLGVWALVEWIAKRKGWRR